jgi:hypothetical protein
MLWSPSRTRAEVFDGSPSGAGRFHVGTVTGDGMLRVRHKAVGQKFHRNCDEARYDRRTTSRRTLGPLTLPPATARELQRHLTTC